MPSQSHGGAQVSSDPLKPSEARTQLSAGAQGDALRPTALPPAVHQHGTAGHVQPARPGGEASRGLNPSAAAAPTQERAGGSTLGQGFRKLLSEWTPRDGHEAGWPCAEVRRLRAGGRAPLPRRGPTPQPAPSAVTRLLEAAALHRRSPAGAAPPLPSSAERRRRGRPSPETPREGRDGHGDSAGTRDPRAEAGGARGRSPVPGWPKGAASSRPGRRASAGCPASTTL